MSRPIVHGRDHFPHGADPLGTAWFYVTPIEPAIAAEDGTSGIDAPGALFEDPWSNIAGYEPTAFRIAENGRPALRVVATGGEDTPGSLIFTLPDGFRPAATQRRFAVVGSGSAGIIDIETDGDVVFVGLIETP